MAKKTHTTTPPPTPRPALDEAATLLLLRLLATDEASDLARLKLDVAAYLKERAK